MNRRRFVGLAGLAPFIGGSVGLLGEMGGKPLIVLPQQARVYDSGQGQTRILVGTEQTGGAWWLGSFVSEPGRKTALHVHYGADEQVYVLEGALSLWVKGQWEELPAGSVAVAPRGVEHALGNRSQQPVRFLVAGEPAGFEQFFADLEATVHRFSYGSLEFLAELGSVYKKYDSKLLGPHRPVRRDSSWIVRRWGCVK